MNEALKFDRVGGGVLLAPVDKIDYVASLYVKKDEGTTAERHEIVDGQICVCVSGKEFFAIGSIDDVWAVLTGDPE